MLYTEQDAQNAPFGHVRFEDSTVEVVAYRGGDVLTVLVNKSGICAYRATIPNAFKEGIASSIPSLTPHEETFIIRYLGEQNGKED